MSHMIRKDILKLVKKNVLDDHGSSDVTHFLLRSYASACEADGVEFEFVKGSEAWPMLLSLYVAERMRLAPSDEARYQERFDWPEALSNGEEDRLPVRLVRDVALEMAARDHANDQAMFQMANARFGASSVRPS